MSNIKKIWSFLIRKSSSDIDYIDKKNSEIDQLDFVLSETQITNDNFFYDTWEKRGSVIYNRQPKSQVKRMILDFEVRIH